MANSNDWYSESLETAKIRLDAENPRIGVATKATQEELRLGLLEAEDVVGLAKGIIAAKGLLKGERIIVTKERGNYIVLEGNRRVSACQMLLNRQLIPPEWADRFPEFDSDSLRQAISRVDADIAPNRKAAQVTITKRHTEPGVRQWTPMAKQRRIVRLLESGYSVDGIINDTGASRAAINKAIQEHRLLQYVRGLKCWAQEELSRLTSPQLRPNAFTRFFTLKGVKDVLGVRFDDKNELVTSLQPNVFGKALEGLARELLLPDPVTGRVRANSRATPGEIFGRTFKLHSELLPLLGMVGEYCAQSKTGPESIGTSGGAVAEPASAMTPTNSAVANTQTPTAKFASTPKTARFFEDLVCQVPDEVLRQLTNEISRVNYKGFPMGATFLCRALLENTLDYCIRHARLTGVLKSEFEGEMGQKVKGKPQPGLDYLITFCLRHHNEIFVRNVQNVLNHWKVRDKDFCDIVIHGRWLVPSEKTIAEMASFTRPFVQNVFNGSVLK